MREQKFHQRARQTTRFVIGFLGVLLIGVLFPAIPSNSTTHAQQDDRQLNREQTQQSNGGAERRLALVIGNGTYTNAPPLKNPPNDARDMAATLKTLGFDVTSGINIDQREMKRLIREFGQKLKAGGSGLFYYAGHGVQSNGRNYLIPVEADIQSEAEVEDSSVDVNLVLKYMDEAQNGLNIVILDACRNNPFARSFRSASNGLAQVDAPTGTLIAYATAPGRVASDGTGDNGLYTSELLKQVRVPGLSATDMFMRVRANVMKQTANRQVPWEASSLVGIFYFSEPANNSSSSQTSDAAKRTEIDPVAVEREYWEAIRSSKDAQDYKNYLQTYPHGAYASIARTKIKQIETNANTSDAQPVTPNSGTGRVDIDWPAVLGWQTLRPGDGFSVLMPKDPIKESRRSLYHGWAVFRNVYRSAIGQRPFFAVMSASGIELKGSDAEKLDSYVDAFRSWLSEAAFGKGAAARLTLIGETSFNGNSGREYQVALAGTSGTARAYFTRGRFFVVVALDVSNDSLTKQFFDSFVLR